MRRWIAIAVLASQMLAGVCALEASARLGGNACCRRGAMPCAGQSCNCCRLDSGGLPSLAAWNPSQVSRALMAVLLPARARALAPTMNVATGGRYTAMVSASPPKLYVLKVSFLI